MILVCFLSLAFYTDSFNWKIMNSAYRLESAKQSEVWRVESGVEVSLRDESKLFSESGNKWNRPAVLVSTEGKGGSSFCGKPDGMWRIFPCFCGKTGRFPGKWKNFRQYKSDKDFKQVTNRKKYITKLWKNSCNLWKTVLHYTCTADGLNCRLSVCDASYCNSKTNI